MIYKSMRRQRVRDENLSVVAWYLAQDVDGDDLH